MSKYLKCLSVLLLFALALPLCAACAKEAQPAYDFPPTQEQMEQLLAAYKLSWYVDEAASFYGEDQARYFLRNDERAAGDLNSGAAEDRRWVTIGLVLPRDYDAEQDQAFREQEWPRWFDLGAALYGSSREAKGVYKKFIALAKNTDITVEGPVIWSQRVGENHYLLDMQLLGGDSRYRGYSLTIRNSAAYEHGIAARAWSMENTENVQTSTVSGMLAATLPEMRPEWEALFFAVHGRLQDIRQPKALPEFMQQGSGTTFPLHKEVYQQAKLVDDTGSLDVLLLPTSLNAAELGMERDHYIKVIGPAQEPTYLVHYSVLP